MSYKFSMSVKELESGISKLPATKQAFVKEVQRLLLAGAEYAVMEQNGSYLNRVLDVLDKALRDVAGRYMSGNGFPFTYDGTKLAFKQTRAIAILKGLGREVEAPKDGSNLPEEALAALMLSIAAIMNHNQWDAEDMKARREKRAAAKKEVTAEELKKRLDRLLKSAKEAGIDEQDFMPQAPQAMEQVPQELAPEMQQVVDMLEPYAGDKQAMATIVAGLASVMASLSAVKAA